MVEKMKKSLLWCLVCLVCLVPCSGAALAAEADAAQDAADGYVYDEAGLLTADEIADLNDEIASFMEESGWNVYAVTTDDAQGKSATAYADDFFDEHSPDKEDGVALLIDMDNREITISTCGIAYNTKCANSQIAIIFFQTFVNENNNEACCQIHQERRHTDSGGVFYDCTAQFVNASAEMKQLVLVGEGLELPHQ